ncbi:MAG: hypothetical protein ACLFSQ_02010 [Candidatus Zixiibacteriota bacterium]
MKKIWILLIIFLCSLYAQQYEQINCPNCERTIDIDSRYCPYCRAEILWGDIKINATPTRTTRFRIQGVEGWREVPFTGKLLAGNYKIIFNCNGKEYSRSLNVKANRQNDLFLDCSYTEMPIRKDFGYLEVKVSDKASFIHVDGRKINAREMVKISPPRRVRLQIASDGYASIDTIINVPKDTLAYLDISLTPIEFTKELNCQRPQLPEYRDTLQSNPSKFIGLGLTGAGVAGIVTPLFIDSDSKQKSGEKKDFPTWHKVTIGVSSIFFISGALFMGKAGKEINRENIEINHQLHDYYEKKLEQYRLCRQEENIRDRVIVENPIKVYYRPSR